MEGKSEIETDSAATERTKCRAKERERAKQASKDGGSNMNGRGARSARFRPLLMEQDEKEETRKDI